MDEPEKNYKLEDTQQGQEAESETVDDLVTQSVNDESPESVKETHDGDESTPDQKKSIQEEEVAALDSVIEPEPFVSLSEEFNQTTKDLPVEDTLLANNKIEESLDDESNGVSAFPAVEVVVDSVSKEIIDSLSGQNAVSPIVSNGIEQALNEINEVSSFGMDSVSRGTEEETMLTENVDLVAAAAADLVVSKENVANVSRCADVPLVVDAIADNDTMSELPESTENQPFIAVIPRPVQRTSWWGCCGLFEVVRPSI